MSAISYAWYIRNARSGFFVALAHVTDSETFSIGGANLKWVRHRRDALRFDEWIAGRDFLKRLDAKGPVPPGWHLIDYRESTLLYEPPQPVKSEKEIISEALAADRVREAIRRAHWTIKPAVAVLGAIALATQTIVGK